MNSLTLIHWLDIFGTLVFASAGALRGMDKRLDIFGVLVFSVVTAVGGGTLRDLLLGLPVGWIRDPSYLALALSAGTLTFYLARWCRIPDTALALADAIGLAVFTIIGAEMANAMNAPALISIVMAVMTACLGGIIRDVMAGEVPLIFHRELYATPCILGAAFYTFLVSLEGPKLLFTWASMGLILVLRIAAIYWQLRLPAWLRSPDTSR
ncbi:trimeric intracellular cation channel family protein [Pokkaliibacter sp. CJK22405]|uniref:trimeric intracellular cation channel family protein n=1 Tax=Pokkaliibacter sp. CJK22405 TaxID=3384615 RepID=UPI0039847C31